MRSNYINPLFREGYNEGERRAVAALCEGKIKDDEIVRLLQKHFDVDYNTAQRLLFEEKRIGEPYRRLKSHLVFTKGYTAEYADQYIISHNIPQHLCEDDKLSNLEPQDLLIRLNLE